jgi:predicted transcriptional regulator
MPDGSLTPAQYEILDAVWTAGRSGASVAEIWQAVTRQRPVARTTVLNLVDRLEKRGWLQRRDEPAGANRFIAAVSRRRAHSALAADFVHDFFDGSASNLVMSLLGSNRLDRREIERLRRLLDDAAADRKRPAPEGHP